MTRLRLAGPALILLWGAWWIAGAARDELVLGRYTWVPVLPMVGGDFRVHIDHVARRWAAGLDPYHEPCDWVCALFPYPAMIPRLFSWVSLVSTETALRTWWVGLVACLAAGAVAAGRTRRALGLAPVPTSLLLAGVLCSAPAILAMDRAQCDPLIVPGLAAAAWLLGRGRGASRGREVAAGGLLGGLAWIKYYPGLTLVGLIALRRWRAAAAFLAVAVAIGAFDRAEFRRSVENGLTLMRSKSKAEARFIHPSTHSLNAHWRSIRVVRQVRWLRAIPSPVAAALLLAPAVGLVSLRVGRAMAEQRDALLFPYGLWLSSAATFAMPYSVDYNLVPLPLAALAVADRRDPPAARVALAVALLTWLQPVALPLAGDTLLILKLATLYAVGASLGAKASRTRPSLFRTHLRARGSRRSPAASSAGAL